MDIHYSLEGVDPDPTTFSSRLNDPDADVKVIGYPLPNGEIWVLYTPGTFGTVDDLSAEFDSEKLSDELDEMDPANRVIAIWLLNFLAEMQEEEKELGDNLSIYKQLEIGKIPDAIGQVDWEGSVSDVAGRLMSNLILRHSLPNANHRTGVTMAQAYLEAAGADFKMPATITEEHDWRSWVQPYIIESKRLLTVRRHNLYFKTLQDWGCEIVRRKHAIDIPLSEYELDMHYHEAWEKYAIMHEQHCIGFVEDIAARANSHNLIEREALSKEEFVDFLRMENQESQ
ncbi:hypothetical protein [Haloplanus halobius]|uniref:hypothetical protein n=1 Tax=Haloplanus halobius TaxID=2934938 RepID=UPI00200D1BC3|nr:hypothetical protein [Haloplanus sp. XH21]